MRTTPWWGFLPILSPSSSCAWLSLSLARRRFGTPSDAFAIPNHAARPTPTTVFSTSADRGDDGDKENWTSGGRIAVEVRKTISFPPGSFQDDNSNDALGEASDRVRDAWMEYHWKKGGGLPIAIIEKQHNPKEETDENGACCGKKRVIAPVMMEETISSFPLQPHGDASLELEYKVTTPGPFFRPDLVQGSHTGRVAFVSSYSPASDDGVGSDTDNNSDDAKAITTTMVWSVGFDAIRLQTLYQMVTEFTIGTAATTVQEAVATPRLLTLQTTLRLTNESSDDDDSDDPAKTARREWLDFLFSNNGGGLPLPPPLPFGDVLPEGGGEARKKLLRFPPGLIETAMVEGPPSASHIDGDETATVYYRLENPGWLTFPFLLHTHLGRARFRRASPEEDGTNDVSVDLTWEIEMRPYAFAAPILETLVGMVASTITRNLMLKLEDPGALVAIKPPRGWTGRELGSVPRATWVGRVLEAHSSDTRSAWEQSVSFLQPWTWAESGGNYGARDCVEYGWSDGKIE